jgi:hypothetical protein
MTCAVGGRGAGGAIAAALLALHVGLVSVEITNPPPRRALAAVGGGCAGRVSVEIAALQADCGWRLLRLRGGKKKEVKGKKIRQPRKLQQIAAVGWARARARGLRVFARVWQRTACSSARAVSRACMRAVPAAHAPAHALD